MRDLNFDNNGELIIEGGYLDTDIPGNLVFTLANRLRVTINKAIPVLMSSFREKFLGIRMFDPEKTEFEIEEFWVSEIINLFPTDTELYLLKCSPFILNTTVYISFYFVDDYSRPHLIYFTNFNF